MDYVQLPFLTKERNSEIKTLTQVEIVVLLIIRMYTLLSSGLINTDTAFSCNNTSSVMLVTVSPSVLWTVCKVLGGFGLVFQNNYLIVLISGNKLQMTVFKILKTFITQDILICVHIKTDYFASIKLWLGSSQHLKIKRAVAEKYG